MNSLGMDNMKGNELISNNHNSSVLENANNYEQKKFLNIKQTTMMNSGYNTGSASVVPPEARPDLAIGSPSSSSRVFAEAGGLIMQKKYDDQPTLLGSASNISSSMKMKGVKLSEQLASTGS
jgi:hypothetical protein